MTRGVLAAVVGAVAMAVAAVAWWGTSRTSDTPPNVLIILWDTVRADRMSLYGHTVPTTPRIDRWAEKYGVVYEHALSPAMWTVPSHASLFTGLAPTTHGAGNTHRWLDDHNVTLAEHFAEHGYHTYAFSANPNLSPKRVNLLQGFESIDTSWSRPWRRLVVQHTRLKLLRRDRSTEISLGNPNHNRVPGFYNAGPVTHRAFAEFLDERDQIGDERPFFAYLSYMEAHKPRVPQLASRRAVTDDDTVRLGLDTDLTFKSQLLYSYGLKDYTEAELEAVNRVYDATLIDLDESTGALLDDLEARGVLENTIVVFTSDHGEQLGEHQQFGHRSAVYQQLLHVPLIIAYPRKLRAQRVSTRVTNLDVFATVLSLAGIPAPETDYKRGDLSAIADLVGQTLFAETISIDKLGFGKVRKAHPQLTRDVWANLYRAAVDPHGCKLIQTISFDEPREVVRTELYDLDADPFETHDLMAHGHGRCESGKLQEQLELLHGALRSWDKEGADADEDCCEGEECEQLALLGYVVPECD